MSRKRITKARYRAPGQDKFSGDILLHDTSCGNSSCIMEQSAGGNPIDIYGNELAGARMYHIVLNGITDEAANDLRTQWYNDQRPHWRFETDHGKEIWETKEAPLSPVKPDGSIVFNISTDYMSRRDIFEK